MAAVGGCEYSGECSEKTNFHSFSPKTRRVWYKSSFALTILLYRLGIGGALDLNDSFCSGQYFGNKPVVSVQGDKIQSSNAFKPGYPDLRADLLEAVPS